MPCSTTLPLQQRTCCTTFCEIVLPILILLQIGTLRASNSDSNGSSNFHLDDKITLSEQASVDWFARYPDYNSPFGSGAEKIVFLPSGVATPLATAFKTRYPVLASSVLEWSSADELYSYMTGPLYGTSEVSPYISAVIEIDQLDTLSQQYSYTLWMNSSTTNMDYPSIVDTSATVDTTQWRYSSEMLNFVTRGELFLQQFIESYFLVQGMAAGGGGGGGNRSSSMPVWPTRNVTVVPMWTPAFTTNSFSVTRMIKLLVEEKELRIKETMRMMGMSDSALWLSWFLTYTLMFLITSILVLIAVGGTLFQHSNNAYIFIFFWLYQISTFAFALLLSTFFSNARQASTFGAVIFLGSFFPYYVLSGSSVSSSSKYAGCLLSPLCFGLTVGSIIQLESVGTGVNADNVQRTIDNFAIGTGIGMLFVDIVLYLTLALYFDKVLPSEWGTQLPWYFPLSPKWWRSVLYTEPQTSTARHLRGDATAMPDAPPVTQGLVEPESASVSHELGVRIVNMRKEFGDPAEPFVAVNDLCLDMYTGRIMSLLGHNGAGKTTSINLLTGMLPVTSGDAYVFGKSITHDMPEIRQFLGVCPQHDVLFPLLTVREHLELFAAIKGVPRDAADRAIDDMIEQVGLVEKVDAFSASLSGGMKRKLSVAIALLGDSKIVFLDEPTSGMDPYSRRSTWDLLKKAKEGRVIILTTHFMDEADELGDRIAIMANGQVQCCGSSLFLKSKYGVGYTMTIVKDANFDHTSIVGEINNRIRDAELSTDVASEMTFRLPLGASAQFADLFDLFDASQERWGINSYGISVTTLEEVFLRVGHEVEQPLSSSSSSASSYPTYSLPQPNVRPSAAVSHTFASTAPSPTTASIKSKLYSATRQLNDLDSMLHDPTDRRYWDEHRVNSNDLASASMDIIQYDGTNLLRRQLYALFIKRLQSAARNRKTWLWTSLLPGLILLVFIGLLARPTVIDSPTRVLDGSEFNHPLPVPFASLNSTVATDLSSFLSASDALAIAPIAVPLAMSQQSPPNTTLSSNITFGMASYLSTSWQTRSLSVYGALVYDAHVDSLPSSTSSAVSTSRTTLVDSVSVFVNTTAPWALPTFYNMYNTALLRNLTAKPKALIRVSMRPLPALSSASALKSALLPPIFGIAFAFVPAGLVFAVVQEREVQSKFQQMISGALPLAYWGAHYAWDLANFVVPAIICIIVVSIFNVSELVGENFGPFFLSLIFYGLSVIPFTYLLAFPFDTAASAQTAILTLCTFVGAFLTSVMLILQLILPSNSVVVPTIKMFLRFMPTYAFIETLSNLILRSSTSLYGHTRSMWDMDVSGYPLLFMALEIPLYSGLVLLIEREQALPTNSFSLLGCFRRVIFGRPEEPIDPNEDADVRNERERLSTAPNALGPIEGEMITIRGLRKVYPPRLSQGEKVAVHDLYLGIPTGECLGFLGLNGAGKSTTMKMLTNEIAATSGDAYLAGMSILTQAEQIRHRIGYCPQFDALIGTLTAREHLYLFGRIRGVAEELLPAYVDALITKVGLQKGIADRPCAGYSGGNKRKLSVGLALIGDPPIVFLDEPSTGMDPASRRCMWDLISQTMRNRSVILTTHSMEECEALCQRIAIMVGGRMRCLGTSQHLKSVHGSGYQLDVNFGETVSKQAKAAFRAALAQTFGVGSVKVVEAHERSVKYSVARTSSSSDGGTHTSIAKLFRFMEARKREYGVSEYAASETSLEQLFIHFARQQEEETGVVAGLEEDEESEDERGVDGVGRVREVRVAVK